MKRFMITFAMVGALLFNVTPTPAQAGDETIGTIIGAVGGGLLGSTLGKGKGRVVGAAAGTVIGAVLGREIATNDTGYDDDYDRPRRRVYERQPERVVYREAPPRQRVVVVKERHHKKWKRVARYDDEILVCNKNGKRCHWYE